ncbi:MerR family transcriptional regulator (plasmid) [Aliirhizobium terrae]|uniref:MerR family transcriptional regulator n=1 Tax=Terrirhizobium terrae TaxID=2926709 RepID=UPI002575F8E7|nr:MerR family transcriptional regulator [Rhizobium sp. CC-CFT758]WJH37808.1 MerR family transcriptional regulator [Rhizobium sp. CC-CFT758]
MTKRSYTIGEAAKLSEIPVRRIRFYADQGLLQKVDRTESGYRLFDQGDLTRLGLIRTLRNAGIGLELIRAVLTQERSVAQILSLQLAEIESQIAVQRRVAAAIRAALRSSEPTINDLRRISEMSTVSNAERVDILQRFLDRVVSGGKVETIWKEWMLEMSRPDLPDNPTDEQIDAWIELSALLADPAFVDKMRRNAEDSVVKLKGDVLRETWETVLARSKDAMSRGVEPGSAEAQSVAGDYLRGWARAQGAELDAENLRRMGRKTLEHKPNMQRYWELVHILKGQPLPRSDEAFSWLDQAVSIRLANV